jgi:predicted HTH domain antitoxin
VSNIDDDITTLRESGGYASEEAVLEDAVRALLAKRPELRTELAVTKYRNSEVSLNRAAELAGVAPAEFKETLSERGITRTAGFLSDAEREAARRR